MVVHCKQRVCIRAGSHYRQNQNLARTKMSKNVKPRTEEPKIEKNFGVSFM